MAHSIKFRPVLFGLPSKPVVVYPIWEEPDGRAVFWDSEISWPLEPPLEALSAEDLPDYYQGRGFPITLLPVQEAVGATHGEAMRKLRAALRAVETPAVEQAA